MAVPTYVAAGAATSGTTTTSVTITKPAGTASGHTLWAIVVNGSAASAPTTVPSGWTLLDSSTQGIGWSGVYWLLAGGSEPANYTWSGFTDSCTGCMIAVSGADGTTPIDVRRTQANTNLNGLCNSITTTAADRLIVALIGVADNTAMSTWVATDPASLTERIEQLSSGGLDTGSGIATAPQGSAGATGNLTVTLAGSRDNSVFLLALKAGGGTTTVTSDLDTRWIVHATVTSDIDLRWPVRSDVTSDLDARWTVRSTVTSDIDLQWPVQTTVTSDLDLRWPVRASVPSDLDVQWADQSVIDSDLDLRAAVESLSEGLLAAYNFDEVSGDVQDLTGNGHDFAISGDASRTVSGHTSGGLTFAGAGGAGPTVTSPALGQTTDRTVMAWLKLDATPGTRWPLQWQVLSIGSGAWGILLLTGTLHIQARNTGGFVRASVTAPTDAAWHHVAGTYQQSTGAVTIYLDGVSSGTATITGPLRTDADHLILGSADGEPFVMDDVRIYDQALTGGDIVTAMNTPVSGGAPVTSDLDLRWAVRSPVTSDLDLRWPVRSITTSDLDARWAVRSTVTSDLDTRWAVRTPVASDLDLRWPVRSITTSDLDARWAVRTGIETDLDVRWKIQVGAATDLDLRWAVHTQVTSDLDLRWRVDGIVTSRDVTVVAVLAGQGRLGVSVGPDTRTTANLGAQSG